MGVPQIYLTAAAVVVAATLLSSARARVAAIFFWRHHRWPRLSRPRTYTEWVQWRKLEDRDPSLARLTDKLHGKELAANRIGSSLVIPTLWQGTNLPDVAAWPMPFIVKANHGCGQFKVVRCEKDWLLARRIAPRWLRNAYGTWLDEWHYRLARRMLLVEPFIGPDAGLPIDYKVFVFDGRARCVQVHIDRAANHRWARFDVDWQRLSPSTADDIARPACLKQMLLAAETIAAGRDHLRVDFYVVDGQLRFGELCLFPGSGLEPLKPASLDLWLGRFWTQARRQMPAQDSVDPELGTLALPVRLA